MRTYFKAVTAKQDDGWMMCDCGNSGMDGNDHYVVTTERLHADEVPDMCTDAKTFAELVARLLNDHYNKTNPDFYASVLHALQGPDSIK